MSQNSKENKFSNFFKNKTMPFLKKITTQPEELRTHTLTDGTKVIEPFSYVPITLLILFILTVISWNATNIRLDFLFSRYKNFFTVLGRMTSPRWRYFYTAYGPMIDTIQMSFLGSLVGALLALPVAFLSASNINKNKYTLGLSRVLLSLVRTLPVLVYAAILALAFGYGVFPGTVAIAIFTFGILTKMLYEQIETIDLSAYVALEATGASKPKAFATAIIPQLLPSYLSYSLYSFEINIRYAAILGYVGAGGIGLLFDDRMAWRQYQDVGVLIVMMFAVVLTIESLSRYFRRRLV
ncbi:phosphonate ABC transporter, permease protein PhnE [Liberiplasma polymorphum]|jgi:phosphonate transport system permease protein|uniref:phosphonate ABC transporter, permease protein PhnE n=1 Tax=Liberiplasma polymorphum TaxID=3374570 RepID=UPI003772B3D0